MSEFVLNRFFNFHTRNTNPPVHNTTTIMEKIMFPYGCFKTEVLYSKNPYSCVPAVYFSDSNFQFVTPLTTSDNKRMICGNMMMLIALMRLPTLQTFILNALVLSSGASVITPLNIRGKKHGAIKYWGKAKNNLRSTLKFKDFRRLKILNIKEGSTGKKYTSSLNS